MSDSEIDLVVVHDLSKTYPGEVKALGGLSFQIARGEVFGLLGPNGAGKSTTVRILTTLCPPTSGTATVAGFDVVRQPERVRQNIGYVGQSTGLDMMASGRDNLHLYGSLVDLTGERLRSRIGEVLELFQLQDAADRPVSGYSGGMRRRLDLACSLLHMPKVLFLDEPTTGLDPQSRALMWELIRRLSGQEGLAVLLTTHYMDEADSLANRLLIIDKGKAVAAGTPAELKSSLRGDFVTIQVGDPTHLTEAEALLSQQQEVSKVLVDGLVLHALVDDSGRAVSQLIGVLKAKGVPIVQTTLNRPSLDDVYLSATGHKYQVGAARPRFFPAW